MKRYSSRLRNEIIFAELECYRQKNSEGGIHLTLVDYRLPLIPCCSHFNDLAIRSCAIVKRFK